VGPFPLPQGARDIPLRLAGLLYAWPDGRTLVGLQAADGSRYRLLERDGEARPFFGPAAVYRHTIRAETLEDRPPALRFCLAHKTWPGWDAQWEERHRTALAWIERALRHLAALDHQWTARATPDAAWSYALTRNPHLVGTLRLGEGYPEFAPDQPRDGRGRWTDSGGGDDSPAAGPMRTERLGREEVSYLVDPADAQAGAIGTPSANLVPPIAPPGVDVDRNIEIALGVSMVRRVADSLSSQEIGVLKPGMELLTNPQQMYPWFYFMVKPGGPWDYKRYDADRTRYEDFGNFNYGATGAALGIPLDVLLRAAGRAQDHSKGVPAEFGNKVPLVDALLGRGGAAPYGDDPRDQKQIVDGFNYGNEYLKNRAGPRR